ncbi:MAG: VOC family protein [Cyanobacteriota bacterium]|nr:VOC family protein [Cyanobacteriota bacterium]
MKIIQSLHTALLVSDLEKANHFYSQILELPQIERSLNFPGTWYQVGNFQIHLIQAPTVIPDEVNPQKWGRNRHLAFSVDDLEEFKQKLIENNCTFQMSSSGRAALFVQDPDGNIIELSQV